MVFTDLLYKVYCNNDKMSFAIISLNFSRNGLRDYEGVAIVWVVVVLEHKVWMSKGTKLRRRRDIRKNRQGFHEEHSKGQPVPIIIQTKY